MTKIPTASTSALIFLPLFSSSQRQECTICKCNVRVLVVMLRLVFLRQWICRRTTDKEPRPQLCSAPSLVYTYLRHLVSIYMLSGLPLSRNQGCTCPPRPYLLICAEHRTYCPRNKDHFLLQRLVWRQHANWRMLWPRRCRRCWGWKKASSLWEPCEKWKRSLWKVKTKSTTTVYVTFWVPFKISRENLPKPCPKPHPHTRANSLTLAHVSCDRLRSK